MVSIASPADSDAVSRPEPAFKTRPNRQNLPSRGISKRQWIIQASVDRLPGRALALPSKDFSAKAVTIRSVPAEMREERTATNNWPPAT